MRSSATSVVGVAAEGDDLLDQRPGVGELLVAEADQQPAIDCAGIPVRLAEVSEY